MRPFWTTKLVILTAPLFFLFRSTIFLTIRYGDRMRASMDVGFSTMENY